jgi:hypothetical protein
MGQMKVETPDGQSFTIDYPDGATDEQINGAIRQHLGGKFESSPINRNAPTPAVADPEDTLLADVGGGVAEIGRSALEGAANVLDHAADWTQSGLNAAGQAIAGSNWGDALNGGQKNDLTGALPKQREGYDTLGAIGRFAGETVASAPLSLLRGGAAVQGLATGALLSDGNDLASVGLDAAAGSAAGFGASKLLQGVAKVADPVVDEGLKTLIQAGTRVTPGQYGRSTGTKFGERLARTEDRAISTPFVGDRIVSDRNQSLTDFARATINRAVQPIGLKLPDNVKPGRGAVKWAGDKLSGKYDELLPKLSATGDDTFLSEMASIQDSAQMLAPDRIRQFNSTLGQLGRYFQGGTQLSGQALKEIDTRLGERVRRFSASNDADQQDLGDAFQAVRDAVHGMLSRQNPDYAGELASINTGWKGLVQVERASANSKAGISPAGYSQAVKQSSDTVRRRGYARGEALNQDLSDAASDILPSEIADSGTAGRWQQSNIPSLLVGAAQLPAYAAARGALPLLTREGATSPEIARLLQYGARAAPIAAPAAIENLRR